MIMISSIIMILQVCSWSWASYPLSSAWPPSSPREKIEDDQTRNCHSSHGPGTLVVLIHNVLICILPLCIVLLWIVLLCITLLCIVLLWIVLVCIILYVLYFTLTLKASVQLLIPYLGWTVLNCICTKLNCHCTISLCYCTVKFKRYCTRRACGLE